MVGGSSSRFQLLDVSGYLENYLWPSYKAGATFEHTISIVLMVNEKYKNGVAALDELSNDEHKCASLYEAVVDLYLQHNIASHEHLEQYLLFFINSFRSIENAKLRKAVLRYVSLPIWESLSKDRLTKELSENVQLAQHWKGFNAHKNDLQGTLAVPSSSASKQNTESASKSKSMSKRKRAEEETTTVAADAPSGEVAVELASLQRDTSWVPSMVNDFLSLLCTEPLAPLARATERYLERFAELLIDLLSQLPTRRFLKVLLEDMHFVIVCRRSPVLRDLKGNLLHKLLSMIDNYINFEVDDQSGQALTYQDMLERSNEKIHFLQQVAYSDFGEVLKDLVFCSVGELSKKEQLLRHLQLLDGPQLVQLGRKLGVITDLDLAISADSKNSRNLVLNLDDEQVLWELLTDFLVPRPRHIDELNMMPLYPNEKLLWDQNQLPVSEHNSGHDVLALPKLNLQFLSIHDYLLRNFTLFRLESAYEIRDDLSDAIKRMGPKAGMRGAVNFGGWARMALPIVSVSIDEVRVKLFFTS